MSGPKMHPRARLAAEAGGEISDAVFRIIGKHDLTYGEAFGVMGDIIQSLAKHMIREERHPDDPEKPGGIE